MSGEHDLSDKNLLWLQLVATGFVIFYPCSILVIILALFLQMKTLLEQSVDGGFPPHRQAT